MLRSEASNTLRARKQLPNEVAPTPPFPCFFLFLFLFFRSNVFLFLILFQKNLASQ